jgi:hypothetical protein
MKPQVKKEDFLNWYFSNRNDKLSLGFDLVEILIKKGIVCIDVEEVFYMWCGYIPVTLTNAKGYNEDHEFEPNEVELID